jgi:hypothetical protein
MAGDVADDRIGILAFGVQAGVRVIFRHPPHASAFVPEDRPVRVVLQEPAEPRGVAGRGETGQVTGPGREGRGGLRPVRGWRARTTVRSEEI